MEAVLQSAIQPDAETLECTHCGTQFESADRSEEFCCGGCRFVHELIQSEGLDQFYDLKGTTIAQPVGTRATAARSWGWLERDVAEAETKGTPTLHLAVQGISCVACVWLIENRFRNHPGAHRITVSPSRGSVELTWERGAFGVVEFAEEIARFGYTLSSESAPTSRSAQDGLTRRLALCGAFAMNGMAFTLPRYLGMPDDFMFASLFETVTAFSATLSLAVGGSYFISRAWHSLRSNVMHIDMPIALGIAVAYVGSVIGWLGGTENLLYFDFVSVFIFLMLAGRRLQTSAIEANRQRLPGAEIDGTTYADAETGESLRAATLSSGIRYKIEPSQVVPVSSRVGDEPATFSLESINGESEPRSIPAAGIVVSGARHLGATTIEVEAVEPWKESMLCLLRQSKGSESNSNLRHERTLRLYLILVLVLGIAGFFGWWFATNDLVMALQVMISVFVVSCPCALGVAIPLADDLAASRMEQIGVYVRRASLWSKLMQVKKLFFDKTGTLTLQRPTLVNPDVLDDLPALARATLRTMASASMHPLCRTLSERLGVGATVRQGHCDETIGIGMRFTDSTGGQWELGKQGAKNGDTHFTHNGILLACFRFRDVTRSGSREQIQELRASDRSIYILSGDDQSKVDTIADALAVPRENALGNLSPEAKAKAVAAIGGGDALYLGDGANDSLAVGESLCSGAAVSDVSLLQDKADFYVLGDNFRFLSRLFAAGRLRASAVRGAFALAIIYNATCLTVALAGLMNPLLAAVLMPLSSIATIAVVNLVFRAR